MRESYLSFAKKLVKTFNKNKIEYMIVGGASAIMQGFNSVTQDVDVYLDKGNDLSSILKSLKALGFKLSLKDVEDLKNGKDFIQFDKPYELDIMFSPDGFENYAQAKRYKIMAGEFPLMNLDGIIKSKSSANRPKDKAVLQLLIDFNKFKKSTRSFDELNKSDYFKLVEGYAVADVQTIMRWIKNEDRSIEENLKRGLK